MRLPLYPSYWAILYLCSCPVLPSVSFLLHSRFPPTRLPSSIRYDAVLSKSASNLYQSATNDGVEQWYQNMEVLPSDDEAGEEWYGQDTMEDWIPDAQKARPKPTHLTPAKEVIDSESDGFKQQRKMKQSHVPKTKSSPYTEEEEELIEAMGGSARPQGHQQKRRPSQRQEGFLGDSTLKEIATDYSVPICYLADVLCMWNVPPPINIHDRLGDLVTGEQAFALVEAVNSLDMGALHDRYSNQNLLQVCYEWNIDIKEAFELAMKEGWSLPFGVRTNLRVEQEEELLRIFSPLYHDDNDEDY